MKCWICNCREADSREHLIKASDMRLFFPDISQESPAYMHSDERRNVPLKSAKTNKIKTSNFVICRRCNDTYTAPHDAAWSELISYMYKNWTLLKKRKKLDLRKVFPGKSNKNCILFHLYFVKLFGCRIVDEKIDIDIDEFSSAIRNNSALRYFYLTFNYRTMHTNLVMAGNIHAKYYSDILSMASWYYTLGELDVQITWFRDKPIKNVNRAWSPYERSKVVQLRGR